MDFIFPEGAPIWVQHLSWLLSKPAFWLVLAKWFLVLVGVIMIASKLLQASHFIWLIVFVIFVTICTLGIYELTQKAAQSFREDFGNRAMLLRVVGFVTDVLALLVLSKLSHQAFFKKKISEYWLISTTRRVAGIAKETTWQCPPKYQAPKEFATARPFDKTQWAQPIEPSEGSAPAPIAHAAE